MIRLSILLHYYDIKFTIVFCSLLTFWLFINQLAKPCEQREYKNNTDMSFDTVLIKLVAHRMSHIKSNTLWYYSVSQYGKKSIAVIYYIDTAVI